MEVLADIMASRGKEDEAELMRRELELRKKTQEQGKDVVKLSRWIHGPDYKLTKEYSGTLERILRNIRDTDAGL